MGDDIVKCLRTTSEFLDDNRINFDDESLFWRDFNSLQKGNLAIFRLNNVTMERVKLAV